MRARFFLPFLPSPSFPTVAFAACALAACADEGAIERVDERWARFATTGRHVTAPLDVGDGVVVGITTRGAGALVDERGAIVSALGDEGDARDDATCVLVRLDADGALLWQTPVRADEAQTRCLDVHLADLMIVARGVTFDVDETQVNVTARGASATLRDDNAWSVTLEEDGLVRELDVVSELDAVKRMDTCAPTLAALAMAFDELIDDTLADVRKSSIDGYAENRGVHGDVAALLVPQGAVLDALVPGATAPAVDPSAVESVATVVSLRPRRP